MEGKSNLIKLLCFNTAFLWSGVMTFHVSITQRSGSLGGAASLRCAIEPRNTPVDHIIWYKAKPNYAICFYHGNDPKQQTGPVGIFKNRPVSGNFDSDNGYHDLRIKTSILSDEDVYECEVLSKQYAKSNSSRFHLRLFYSPSPDPIMLDVAKNIQIKSSRKCNVDADIPVYSLHCNRSSVVIGCRSLAYRPPPTIAWQLQITHNIMENKSIPGAQRGATKAKSAVSIVINRRNESFAVTCHVLYQPDSAIIRSQNTAICVKLQRAACVPPVPVLTWVLTAVVVIIIIAVILVLIICYYKRRKEKNIKSKNTYGHCRNDGEETKKTETGEAIPMSDFEGAEEASDIPQDASATKQKSGGVKIYNPFKSNIRTGEMTSDSKKQISGPEKGTPDSTAQRQEAEPLLYGKQTKEKTADVETDSDEGFEIIQLPEGTAHDPETKQQVPPQSPSFLKKLKHRIKKGKPGTNGEDKTLKRHDKRPPSIEIKSLELRVTHTVVFDIKIDKKKEGKIVLGLFGDKTPAAVKHFIQLVKGKGKHGYKNSTIHKVLRGQFIEGGKNVQADKASSSFAMENFKLLKHDAGWISMVNTDKASESSQFTITTGDVTDMLDDQVVFGKVLEGQDLIQKIDKIETQPLIPRKEVKIFGSSAMEARDNATVCVQEVVQGKQAEQRKRSIDV